MKDEEFKKNVEIILVKLEKIEREANRNLNKEKTLSKDGYQSSKLSSYAAKSEYQQDRK